MAPNLVAPNLVVLTACKRYFGDMRLCVASILTAVLAAGMSTGNASAQVTTRVAAATPTSSPAIVRPALPPVERPVTPLEKAISQSTSYLLSQIGTDGKVAGEYPATSVHFGGKTALCVYALLSAEVPHTDPAVRRAVEWLAKQKLTGTYAVSMRACAFAAMYSASGEAGLAAPLAADLKWLIEAADITGAYTYTSSGGKASDKYDNSSTQMAVLGIWTASQALRQTVPVEFWRKVEQHWVLQQQGDGGWGYLIPPGEVKTRSYGSMTAAGLVTLMICQDDLSREQIIRAEGNVDSKSVQAATKWLADHFKDDENPGKEVEWYYYWLYSMQRVGLASGIKTFGGHDWYAEGSGQLLSRRNTDGSWGYGDKLVDTSMALLFLVHGRHPVLMNKLQYPGKWNSRRRDAANFARWWSYTFERHVTWQAVSVDAAFNDWSDSPILYISGSGPIELGDEQIARLKMFVEQGGCIVSEAAGNSGDFTLDLKGIYRKLFPDYPLKRLPAEHPLYKVNVPTRGDPGLLAISNGERLLAVHAPQELSLGLQLPGEEGSEQAFQLLANVCLYVTDKGAIMPRGFRAWPKAQTFKPAATITVCRVRHDGNWNPEPLAIERLGRLMAESYRLKLDVIDPVNLADLDAAKCAIAIMTGTEGFTVSDEQAKAIRKFISEGGTIVVDAAGGSRPFAAAVEKSLLPVMGEPLVMAIEHPVYMGPSPVKIAYRREFAESLGKASKEGRLMFVEAKGRPAIIYSADDLTCGLVGCSTSGIRGYTSDCATALMTNILCNVAGVKSGAAATPKP